MNKNILVDELKIIKDIILNINEIEDNEKKVYNFERCIKIIDEKIIFIKMINIKVLEHCDKKNYDKLLKKIFDLIKYINYLSKKYLNKKVKKKKLTFFLTSSKEISSNIELLNIIIDLLKTYSNNQQTIFISQNNKK